MESIKALLLDDDEKNTLTAVQFRPAFQKLGREVEWSFVHTPAEAWEALAPEQRLSHRQTLTPSPRGVFDPLQASHALLLTALGKAEVLAALGAATSVPLADTRPVTTFIGMRVGDFQGYHSDRVPGRRLCSALYLSDGWRPGFGGEFEMAVGGQTIYAVPPLANRIVLFDPGEQTTPPVEGLSRHRIRTVEPAAGDWRRISMSTWWTAS